VAIELKGELVEFTIPLGKADLTGCVTPGGIDPVIEIRFYLGLFDKNVKRWIDDGSPIIGKNLRLLEKFSLDENRPDIERAVSSTCESGVFIRTPTITLESPSFASATEGGRPTRASLPRDLNLINFQYTPVENIRGVDSSERIIRKSKGSLVVVT